VRRRRAEEGERRAPGAGGGGEREPRPKNRLGPRASLALSRPAPPGATDCDVGLAELPRLVLEQLLPALKLQGLLGDGGLDCVGWGVERGENGESHQQGGFIFGRPSEGEKKGGWPPRDALSCLPGRAPPLRPACATRGPLCAGAGWLRLCPPHGTGEAVQEGAGRLPRRASRPKGRSRHTARRMRATSAAQLSFPVRPRHRPQEPPKRPPPPLNTPPIGSVGHGTPLPGVMPAADQAEGGAPRAREGRRGPQDAARSSSALARLRSKNPSHPLSSTPLPPPFPTRPTHPRTPGRRISSWTWLVSGFVCVWTVCFVKKRKREEHAVRTAPPLTFRSGLRHGTCAPRCRLAG